jgi:hypothetical protein
MMMAPGTAHFTRRVAMGMQNQLLRYFEAEKAESVVFVLMGSGVPLHAGSVTP